MNNTTNVLMVISKWWTDPRYLNRPVLAQRCNQGRIEQVKRLRKAIAVLAGSALLKRSGLR